MAPQEAHGKRIAIVYSVCEYIEFVRKRYGNDSREASEASKLAKTICSLVLLLESESLEDNDDGSLQSALTPTDASSSAPGGASGREGMADCTEGRSNPQDKGQEDDRLDDDIHSEQGQLRRPMRSSTRRQEPSSSGVRSNAAIKGKAKARTASPYQEEDTLTSDAIIKLAPTRTSTRSTSSSQRTAEVEEVLKKLWLSICGDGKKATMKDWTEFTGTLLKASDETRMTYRNQIYAKKLDLPQPIDIDSGAFGPYFRIAAATQLKEAKIPLPSWLS
ncbi:hypothetical protein FRB90_010762 [Tulasnella sp. 427]|nr:hypothetical protein FRB90_010762 [Tulasnella sp. 427]